ncbi:probable GTP-binding protein OBGM, mitochondrial isoform X2 [Spinacia oleracea]|uniref:Probable GTP-binding protein OBGM, mitochondrial isoform X2 n=1 Tax=Spinacia oleracea TaxID=3562 RepID=A0ABM3QJD9_SPIOL|nr:probable GTP-binding protein OBGM, mitochondrial isoform X2 [Spinacia oleracea]
MLREVTVEVGMEVCDVVELIGMASLMNGRWGGHGTSKNKIGSRGEDKVVQVPVSTAIYFVESEIPSIVEKSSSVIHPWDATKDTEDKTRHQIQVNTKTRHQILLPSKHIKFSQETYSSENVDEVRDVWVEYFLKQDEDEDEENKDVGMEITP